MSQEVIGDLGVDCPTCSCSSGGCCGNNDGMVRFWVGDSHLALWAMCGSDPTKSGCLDLSACRRGDMYDTIAPVTHVCLSKSSQESGVAVVVGGIVIFGQLVEGQSE